MFYVPKNIFFKGRYEERIILVDLQWDSTHVAEEVLKFHYGNASEESLKAEIDRRKKWQARVLANVFEMFPPKGYEESRGKPRVRSRSETPV